MKRDTRTREKLRGLPVFARMSDRVEFDTLDMTDLRLVTRLLEHAGALDQVTEASALEISERSDRRLDQIQRGLRYLVGRQHPATLAVSSALSRVRNEARAAGGRDTRSRELILQSTHWGPFRALAGTAALSMAQLRATDRLLARYGTLEAITEAVILEVAAETPNAPVLLRAAFRKLVGDKHPASSAVTLALARQQNRADANRDRRPREIILASDTWDKLRDLPAAKSLPMDLLRVVDRFFAYCSARNLRHIQACDVANFDKVNEGQGPLQRLRDGLRALYGAHHPIVHTVSEARIAKSRAYYEATAPARTIGQGRRTLLYSIPETEVPALWLETLARLEAGERVRGRKTAASCVQSMRMQARYLLWAARREGLPDGLSLEALRAYDQALDERGTRASSRAIAFGWLRMLAFYVGAADSIVDDARSVSDFYERLSRRDLPLKEDRLADLPDLADVFELAGKLLVEAASETHSTAQATLYTDAGALALLSLIPFRNQDTVLLWGEHLTYRDERYHLDKAITKTGAAFTGKLHRILDPFIDALLLRGRPPALLPQLREAAIQKDAPLFPKSNGAARSVTGLSRRWNKRVGMDLSRFGAAPLIA
ncbi:hypothetical protein [Sediminimonas qiaohouensis]|uniref:hypothetical protein n=1 Tax=Sediminimonas qiaohouensis TaxID=552061 RepID=UPI0003F6D591|nr:hypothetical protein [Sediminimonas qiaohouensis]